MEIKENDLFYNGTITVLSNGAEILESPIYNVPTSMRYDLHTVCDGDEITKLAYKYYKNKVQDSSKFWFVIAIVNDLAKPWSLEIGSLLKIPDILQWRLFN